jgi:hypothetical protein
VNSCCCHCEEAWYEYKTTRLINNVTSLVGVRFHSFYFSRDRVVRILAIWCRSKLELIAVPFMDIENMESDH